MNRIRFKKRKLLLGIITGVLLLAGAGVHAQIKPRLLEGRHNRNADSLAVKTDTSVPVIVNKIENYSYTIDHTNFLFRNPLNISPIYADLNEMEKRLAGFKSRLELRGKQMNLRSVNSSIILLKEIADKLSSYKRILGNYDAQLRESNAKVKKILDDPALKLQLADSVLHEQLQDLLEEGRQLDSAQAQLIGRVNLLLNHVSITLLQARDIISDMGYLSAEKKISMWNAEYAPLFDARPSQYGQTLAAVIGSSLDRSVKIIGVYLAGKWKVLSWSIVALLFTLLWMASNVYRLRKAENRADMLAPVHFLTRGLVAAALFGYLTYSPFFFANPPMSYLHAVELIRLFLLAYLLAPFISQQARLPAMVVGITWILYAVDDIFLDAAFGERWVLAVLAVTLISAAVVLLRQSKPFFNGIEQSPAAKPVLILGITLAVLSLGFNISGRLALAKIAGITAIQAVILAITLKVFFTLVVEAVYLQFKTFSVTRLANLLNFSEMAAKMARVTWTLAIIIWLVSLIRNLTFYDEMVQLVSSFVNQRRSIGSMVFTFRSIIVFIVIVWISVTFSAVINFFFGSHSVTDAKKKGRLGSLMLLIRLTIWILGFLIGVSAAGIPLDKLSLMLGAFGVGIGFGLQNIVNNLVSGVILAFERPIQVGDSIEVANRSGVVQEIGVRSSKIRNSEGANIIIPNGDLLSQQLVNWTMQDNTKRVDFSLTFPLPGDIEKIKSIVFEELKKNEHVLQSPAPAVNVQDFQTNAVQLKILWWIPDLTKAGAIRSEVMQEVYESLTRAGVAFEK